MLTPAATYIGPDANGVPMSPDEYRAIGVQEYWVIDRFRRQMTVFTPTEERVVAASGVYRTDLLPGFELSLEALLRTADAWINE